ncbi:MAG: hypothetical protein Ct9H300mP16_12450 [Pseudomonadota bacterium]|nr:MAG: hypothetical protein Ct9H300mP16_12450 [Pseudomonadota bacterium]
MSRRIVLASNNGGKLAELQALLSDMDIEFVPQGEHDVPEAEERGLTFVENAIIKARNATRFTGLPAIADDSGIEVDHLGGEPGVRSARYAGRMPLMKTICRSCYTNSTVSRPRGGAPASAARSSGCVTSMIHHPSSVAAPGRATYPPIPAVTTASVTIRYFCSQVENKPLQSLIRQAKTGSAIVARHWQSW